MSMNWGTPPSLGRKSNNAGFVPILNTNEQEVPETSGQSPDATPDYFREYWGPLERTEFDTVDLAPDNV